MFSETAERNRLENPATDLEGKARLRFADGHIHANPSRAVDLTVLLLQRGVVRRAFLLGTNIESDPHLFRIEGAGLMEMFNEITKHHADGTKIEERNEFQLACDDFRLATRRWATIDFRVHTDNNADVSQWFYWLGRKYATEMKLWELFCKGFETDKMLRLYIEFRTSLLNDSILKPNA